MFKTSSCVSSFNEGTNDVLGRIASTANSEGCGLLLWTWSRSVVYDCPMCFCGVAR